ncbi:MAG: calcium/sodium antiporter [Erysipelotrichaceae bacterium]|nr:calcium/sodium antiporter [Erysipelotrichaceae bacterium]
MMLKTVFFFIFGLFLLTFGGDCFVGGATGIARRFHVSDLLIGATVVSIGTTLPEVMVSATGALAGHSQIAYGNALGSIICNTALISAISIAFKPSEVDRKTLIMPVSFFFIAALVYCLSAYNDAYYSRTEGIILLIIFAAYVFLEIRSASRGSDETTYEDTKEPVWKDLAMLVMGAAAIAWGADFLVDNGTVIAKAMGVPESVIALTFMALGTSLPELVTAIIALRKGHGLLSLGNIIGANLFNLVLVGGISIVLAPFHVPADKLINGMNASFLVDIPMMLAVMLIMTVPPLLKEKLYRWQGIILLLLYFSYCLFQFAV